MTTYDIKGTVENVGETREVGRNGFTKRDLVIETNPHGSQFKNPVKVSLKKDRCALADKLNIGDEVTVQVTIDGRRWDGPNGPQYFTDFTVWKIITAVGNATTAATTDEQVADTMPADDVLPF